MIEVFKTNVEDQEQADMLVCQIHKSFNDYTANFDLEDCDRILRVQCTTRCIHSTALIHLLENFGFHAEILPDDQPVDEILHLVNG